jgi:hypothetical protein
MKGMKDFASLTLELCRGKQIFDLRMSHLWKPFLTKFFWHHIVRGMRGVLGSIVLFSMVEEPRVVGKDHHLSSTEFALLQFLLQPKILILRMLWNILTEVKREVKREVNRERERERERERDREREREANREWYLGLEHEGGVDY